MVTESSVKKNWRVATLTVTYNAEVNIGDQIDALARQTYPIGETVVVDSASQDNTREVLASKYKQVTVISLATNEGIGGAVATGLDYAALTKGYDWVWILDADSIPASDALESLIGALDVRIEADPAIGMLASSPKHSGTKLSYSGLVWDKGWRSPGKQELHNGAWSVDAVISSGSLISREVVQDIGLPRADFFMDFVDFEYCLRMRRAGYKILVVAQSTLEHTIGEPRTVKVLGFSHAWGVHSPWREYYFSRNYLVMIKAYYPDWRSTAYVIAKLVRHALAILLFGVSKIACLRMMWLGYLDGRAGRLGIRFTAETERILPSVAATAAAE
jgi:GT2 family glycosyltransferase